MRPVFNPWVGKIPWRRTWQPTPVSLPEESPWTEEPGWQSMESQRVWHDWETKHAWTIARPAPPSMGFSRQEYWSGFPCPPPRELPDPGMEPASLTSPALAGGFFTTSATWEALWIALIYFWMFNPPCRPGINLWSWRIILFIPCQIQLINIILRTVASPFMRDVDLWFPFLVISLSDFDMREMPVSENELRRIPFSSIFWKRL